MATCGMRGRHVYSFADTNVGKSILAVQIANAVAAGNEPFIPFIECEAGRQPVIYADLELSKRQFLNRYSSPDGMPIFLDRGLDARGAELCRLGRYCRRLAEKVPV